MIRASFALTCLSVLAALPLRAADPKDIKEVRDKALAFLAKSQQADGGFSTQRGPGITALVTAALLRSGVSPNDPVASKAIAHLEKHVKKDGGIYDKGLANYTTSVAVMAFSEANKDGKYDNLIKNATAYLRKLQYGDGVETGDVKYGGASYDGTGRPDMSNTQFMIDALIAAGVPKNDPAIQRALRFINRCQNLAGEEANDQPFAKKAAKEDEGGLVYKPFVDPDDKRHTTPDGGLRSVGAMTYAGLKSFLYAGVSKDDPRVKGALKWIRQHYTLDANPGMGTAGLYYYYHTFGKTMTALGDDEFTDADGKKHDWRTELFEAIKKRQQENGSWINDRRDSFGEGDPNIATAFALLSLTYCKK